MVIRLFKYIKKKVVFFVMKKALPFLNKYFIITFSLYLIFWLCTACCCYLFRDSIVDYIILAALNIFHFFVILFYHTDHSLKVGFVLFIFFLIIKKEDIPEEIYCRFGFIYHFVNFIDDYLFRYIFFVFSFCVFSLCTYTYGGILITIYSILVSTIVSIFFFSIINDTYKARRDKKFPLSFAYIVFYHFIFFLIFVKYKDLMLLSEEGTLVFWKYFCLAFFIGFWYHNTIGWLLGDKLLLMSSVMAPVFGYFSDIAREKKEFKDLPEGMEVSIIEIITFAKPIPRHQDFSLWGWEVCMGRLYAESYAYAFLGFQAGYDFLWSLPFLILAFTVSCIDWVGWTKINDREEKKKLELARQKKILEEQNALKLEAEFKWMRKWTKKYLKRRARAKKKHLKYLATGHGEYPMMIRRNKKLKKESKELFKKNCEYTKMLEQQKRRVFEHPNVAIRQKKHNKEMRELKAELKRWREIDWEEWRKRGGKV